MGLNEAQKKERSKYLEEQLEITECSQRKPYVFVSYASDNWETVFKTAVVPMQKKYGLRVYADKAFDKVNDKWIVPMLRNIRGADAVIAFVSQRYIESYACFLELLTAVNNRKQIIFVSLEENLHLGDTTDLPNVERGVKKEILNQGANIATNTNNTSNDIMRAIKSAYTSISTLLEQDALSKYDISDAFINFFRDAAINKKTINDLNAVKGTIASVSRRVFDPSLIAEQPHHQASAAPAQPAPAEQPHHQASAAPAQPAPAEQPHHQASAAPAQPVPAEQPHHQASAAPAQAAPAEQPHHQASAAPAQPVPAEQPYHQTSVSQTEPAPDNSGAGSGTSGGNAVKGIKPGGKKALIACGAGFAALLALIITLVCVNSTKKVTDMAYTDPNGNSGTYTGEWKNDQPNGQGVLTWANGVVHDGVWKNGVPDGKGTRKDTGGNVFEGEWANNELHGTASIANGDRYEGDWNADGHFIQGTLKYANGNVFTGDWDQNTGLLYKGTATYTNGDVFTGDWDKNTGKFYKGTATYANGDVFEGEWDINTGFFSYGTITYTNGNVYKGQFANGYINGQGTMTNTDGSVYTGQWVNGLANGQGKKTASDGTYYEGEWKDGLANGYGTLKNADGTELTGTWKDGNFVQ